MVSLHFSITITAADVSRFLFFSCRYSSNIEDDPVFLPSPRFGTDSHQKNSIFSVFLSAGGLGRKYTGNEQPNLTFHVAADPMKTEDQTLLRCFARERDEEAFRMIVEKYTALVFGVAMRHMGQQEQAEEVTQNVFLALARKAHTLHAQRSLGAWLHRAATLEALRSLRQMSTQQRHLAMIREHQEIHRSTDETNWNEVRPFLDGLLDRLSKRDREILVQHYFEGLEFSEIASRSGIRAATAQKRSIRAIRKLSNLLKRRGVVVSSALLATGLGAELGMAVPAGLAAKIGTSVLGSVTAATTTMATGLMTSIATSKLTLMATVLLAASVPVVVQLADSKNVTAERGDVAFDEERFRAALEELRKDSRLRLDTRDFQRLVFSLQLEELPKAVSVLNEIEDERLNDILQAVFSRWAELDPLEAVVQVGAPKDSKPYAPAFCGAWITWAFADWDAASDWYLASEHRHNDGRLFALGAYLETLADRDGPLAVDRAFKLRDEFPGRGEDLLQGALSAWAVNDSDRVTAWIFENIVEREQRDLAIFSAFQRVGLHDPDRALDGFSLIEDDEMRRGTRSSFIYSWTDRPLHALEAVAYFEERPGLIDTWHINNMYTTGERLSRHAPTRTVALSRQITDPSRRDLFCSGILASAPEDNPSIVIEAANVISADFEPRGFTAFLTYWWEIDKRQTEHWVRKLPEGKKKAFAMRHLNLAS